MDLAASHRKSESRLRYKTASEPSRVEFFNMTTTLRSARRQTVLAKSKYADGTDPPGSAQPLKLSPASSNLSIHCSSLAVSASVSLSNFASMYWLPSSGSVANSPIKAISAF